MLESRFSERQLFFIEFFFIIAFSIFPLFFTLPFRDNLYLTWEGSYRLYLGQIPFKDFGMPLGFGFFIFPTIFFKIFGPFLSSLLKAQFLINVLSLLSFRTILKTLNVKPAVILFSTLVFCFSYTFIFFWPWYNNTAFVFELFAIQFILHYIFQEKSKFRIGYLVFASVFTFLSFFTKQDYGGLAFFFCLALIILNLFYERKIVPVLIYVGATFLTGFIVIKPFLKYGFGYWFNYGQPPHQSRLKAINFLNSFLGDSNWEKFYIFIFIVIILYKLKDVSVFLRDKKAVFFALITIGIIAETLITKVTSRLPSDTTTYFHAFAFAFLLTNINLNIAFEKVTVLPIFILCLFLWWSAMFWKYAGRMLKISDGPVVGVKDQKKADNGPWILTGLKSFGKVSMPEKTVEGLHKIIKMDFGKKAQDLKVLNMSELTPLSYELKYTPVTDVPLWYHLNIGMFDKQVDEVNQRILHNEFDLILFEEVPSLDNFYPEKIRDVLRTKYKLIDTFPSPRKEDDSFIEVYQKN